MKKVRLLDWQVEAIKRSAKEAFGEKTKVLLFGSRVYPEKRGGDIDLYVIPEKRDDLFGRKLKFRALLMKNLGERNIDVVIQKDTNRPIEKRALEEGVEL